MDAERFRQAVRNSFGPSLDQATYHNVRQFVAWFNSDPEVAPVDFGRYFSADDAEQSLEGSVKAFLDEVLDADTEEAMQRLWVATLELWYSIFESSDEETCPGLVDDLSLPDERA